MKLNPFLIRILGDALIPVLGFVFWNWGIFFILIYYFLDLLISEVLMHFKSKKVLSHSSENPVLWWKLGILSFSILLLAMSLVILTMYFYLPGFNLQSEIIDFMTYEDMGIQQGYILIPLLIFVAWQQYRMDFLMRAQYRNMNLENLWKPHLRGQLAFFAFSALGLAILKQFHFPEWLLLALIVFITTAYGLKFKQN